MPARAMLRRLWMPLVLATTAACHDGPFSPFFDRGLYDLISANGEYVPSTVYSAVAAGHVQRVDVQGGTLTLHSDGSYNLLVHARESTDGVVVDVTHAYAGAYDAEDTILYLSYDVPGSNYGAEMQAVWRDGTIEVVVPDVAMGHGVLMRFAR